MNSDNQKLFQERDQRYIQTVLMQKADRVPTSFALNYFPAKFAGIKKSVAFYDLPRWREAFLKSAQYIQPDRCIYFPNQSGRVLETMQNKTNVWPGHGLPENQPLQFVEGEYMRADEYDQILEDQADFNIRCLMPRHNGLLAPLARLPALSSFTLMGLIPTVADEDFADMLEKVVQAAREDIAWHKACDEIFDKLNELGFPGRQPVFAGGVPFDQVSDFLRGMRGSMLDMYRCPDKLMALCEKFMKQTLRNIAAIPRPEKFTHCFVALHRGSDGFMNLKQFEKFYWPHFKKLIEAQVAAGLVPDIFFEGDYTQRLDYLQELPHGKILARFDHSDMTQVARKLGGKFCISGGMPSSILQTGTKEEVKKYAAWLIDTCARDGGYVMAPSSALDEVNPENLRTLVTFTAEYGKYK